MEDDDIVVLEDLIADISFSDEQELFENETGYLQGPELSVPWDYRVNKGGE